MLSPESIHRILKSYWGYETLRPLQEDIILSILNGKETIGLLPTGGGKSICFQVPALMMPGYSLIISPLIALIKDQVQALRKLGIDAAGISHEMPSSQINEVYQQCISGKIKLLYVSPERLSTVDFLVLFREKSPDQVVVDEAHCISQWGHDFRPAYLMIKEIRAINPDIRIHAFTATAGKKVLTDIKVYLGMHRPVVFRKSYRRENIAFYSIYTENKWTSLLHFVKHQKGTGIIYVRNRKQTEQISQFLNEKGFESNFYHAGLPVHTRDEIQKKWMEGEGGIIACTNAFGMGVDKATVKYVLHFDLPEDIESYYQEAGRAGRDGREALAIIFYDHGDIRDLEKRVRMNVPKFMEIRRVFLALREMVYDCQTLDRKAAVNLFDLSRNLSVPVQGLLKSIAVLIRMNWIKTNDASIESIYSQVLLLNDFKGMDNRYGKPLFEMLKMWKGNANKTVFSVDEVQLARQMNIDVGELIELLHTFQKSGELSFQIGNREMFITFIELHPDLRSLYKYWKWRRHKLKKMKFMQDFTATNLCRQMYILRYFGENTLKKCKKCDICLKKDRKVYSGKSIAEGFRKLTEKWDGEEQIIDKLILEFPFFDRDKFAAVLHWMHCRGMLLVKGRRISRINYEKIERKKDHCNSDQSVIPRQEDATDLPDIG